MNSLCCNFISLSPHSCCNLRIIPSSLTDSYKCTSFRSPSYIHRLVFQGNREFVCRDSRVNDTEAEPESNDDKEGGVHNDAIVPPLTDSNEPLVDQKKISLAETLNSLKSLSVEKTSKTEIGVQETKPQTGTENKGKSSLAETLNALKSLIVEETSGKEISVEETKPQTGIEEEEKEKVASGSPLPGVKPEQLDEAIRIPEETMEILRNQVFGFDTFFVTSQESYEGGVLFKGNLRGKAANSYEKLAKRMEDKLGDQYKLFLLNNPEDDKPVAVVVPRRTLQPEEPAIPEWLAAGAFGVVTVFTLLLRNVPALQLNLLSTFDNIELLKDGLPGALVTALVLGVHEISHILVAKDAGVKLSVPYFVPSWQIGSFGAITRIKNVVPKREDLLKIAAAGPIAGFSLGLVLLLLGFILPPSDGIGIVLEASVFHESLLVGGIAKVLLGDALKEGSPISINPLVMWAWAGLLINAINSIPAGELDGGRISLSIWGRKVASRLSNASIALLGLSSLFNDVAFYWVVLIVILQRKPTAPLSEEITDPDNKYIALGVSVLLLGLLVCLPYPIPFTTEAVTNF